MTHAYVHLLKKWGFCGLKIGTCIEGAFEKQVLTHIPQFKNNNDLVENSLSC